MADLADKLKAAGIKIKLIKATGQILYKAVGLDGMWVPSDALGVGYAADEIESALKDKNPQLKEGREEPLLALYQKLTVKYPEVSNATVKLTSRQIVSAGKNGLLLQISDGNGNLAKIMANKSQIETTPDGEVMLQIGNDFSYDFYDDGTHGTIRGARLIEKTEEENQTTPLKVILSTDQIKAMSVRGVTISLPQDGIERLFIPEKYVVRDVAAGRCAVYLYPNHQYSYVPTGDEHKRLSVNGEKLGSLLGATIKQTSEGSSLSRRIAAVERRMGIENAKNLGETLLGMADQNLYTAGDYDTVIRNLRKNQIDLANEIAEMQEKKKGFATAAKNLQLCKTYRSVWLEYTGLPLNQETEFYATHSQELQAYHSAAAKLEKEGVDQSVEPEKVIALAEGVEQRIEELKAQVEEASKQEEKIV